LALAGSSGETAARASLVICGRWRRVVARPIVIQRRLPVET